MTKENRLGIINMSPKKGIYFLYASMMLSLLLAKNTDEFRKIKQTNLTYYIETMLNNKELNIQEINNIMSTTHLKEDEKQFLTNQKFFKDYIKTIKDFGKDSYIRLYNLKNIKIESFNENEEENLAGYYTLEYPDILFIRNYINLLESEKDTVAHEFIHLMQDESIKNINSILTEASAEIISKEYFIFENANAYIDEIKILCKLMEIVGSKAIWDINFAGDYTELEKETKDYLREDEYEKLIHNLTKVSVNSDETNDAKKELKEIIAILYENKYASSIEDDEIMNYIEYNNEYFKLTRYYFNDEYTNEENSYIEKYDYQYQTISYKEAIETEKIKIYMEEEDGTKHRLKMGELINNPYSGTIRVEVSEDTIFKGDLIITIKETVNKEYLPSTKERYRDKNIKKKTLI